MISNLKDLIDKIVNNIVEVLSIESTMIEGDSKGKVELSQYELDKLNAVFNYAYQTIPANKSQLTDMIQQGLALKSDINYFILNVKNKKRAYTINYNQEYNKLFTILTKAGRPSKDAIRSEMFYTKPEMEVHDRVISQIDDVLEVLDNQKSIIDMYIRSLESRRYELGL